ncbi:MAG TPA: leucyl aminopeptidase [Acidimicrobiia bacterium]
MIRFEAPRSRSKSVPHAIPVLSGVESAIGGYQAALNRSSAVLARQGFTGKLGQIAQLDDGLIAVGLGEEASADSLRAAAGSLGRHLGKVDRLATSLHEVSISGATGVVVEGIGLGAYHFSTYKSEADQPHVIELPGAKSTDIDQSLIGVEAETFARDLINTPAADKAPADLAERISERARAAGVKVEIWDESRMEAEQMAGTLGVGAGSSRPPRFVRLSYRPNKASRTVALVGKGIVFDSGGLSIKPADAMETMKTDMSGAAAVAAATAAIARRKLRVGIEAYLPLTDNMSGGNAIKPGDVIRYRNSRTIEVLNTDAEGRLVLADGLILAAESDADLIVDIATLTGAQRVSLGDRVGAVFGAEREDADLVTAAGAMAGERFWPMPLVADYDHMIKSEIADHKNTGGRYGGSITAALILAPFTAGKRWVHLDIAGPARAEKAYNWYTAGGTGFGTRTLIALAEMLAKG